MADRKHLPEYWQRNFTYRLCEELEHEHYTLPEELIELITDCVAIFFNEVISLFGSYHLCSRFVDVYPEVGLSSKYVVASDDLRDANKTVYNRRYNFHELMEIMTPDGLDITQEEFNTMMMTRHVDQMLWQQYWLSKLYQLNSGYTEGIYAVINPEVTRRHLLEVLASLPLYKSKLYMRAYYCQSIDEVIVMLTRRLGVCAAAYFHQQTTATSYPYIPGHTELKKYIRMKLSLPKLSLSEPEDKELKKICTYQCRLADKILTSPKVANLLRISLGEADTAVSPREEDDDYSADYYVAYSYLAAHELI